MAHIDLSRQLQNISGAFLREVEAKVQAAVAETAEETAAFLRDAGGYDDHRAGAKSYRSGFAVRDVEGLERHKEVYNKQYMLTHLLEYGHIIRNGTQRKYGETRAFPHWAQAEAFAERKLQEKVARRLEEMQ